MITLINTCLVLLFLLTVFFLLFLCYRHKNKGIGYKKYLELMDFGEKLKGEISDFISRKTYIKFTFINLNYHENYNKLKCEWLNQEYVITDKIELSNEINNTNNIKEVNNINALIKQKVELIKNNKKKEFTIDIYLHQYNHYYIITNIHENQAYSLDTIYYSKDKNLIPKKLMFEGNNITTDDYNIENMRRVTLINIDKKSCVNFIHLITKEKINEEDEEIFGNKIYDLFLNIKIKNENSFESSLFLNRNNNDIYVFTPKELFILKIFKEGLIMKYINKYKNYSINDIDKEIENNFIKKLNAFALRYFSDFEKRMKNYKSDEETIPFIYYMTQQNLEKNESKIDKHLNIKEITDTEKTYGLYQLKMLTFKFFDCPIERRYINEPTQKDYELIETLCYLKLATNAKFPLESIILYEHYTKKIINEVKDFSMKEKIKIICCIRSHLDRFIPTKLKLQKMIDLPENSPYLKGEIMYRNIIKNLTDRSKLKFAFLQLNFGGGYELIHKKDCYLLKMLPLIVIKSHLLNIPEDYFFIYSSIRENEYAYIDPFSKIESINEIKVFEAEDISFQENEDNSIKVCLIHFHEKGGHKKYSKREKSPRYVISNDFDLYDNYSIDNDLGKSGNVLEDILLGNSNYIATLISCKNLKNLSNYELFTDESGENLFIEINDIFERNKAKIDIKDKKTINGKYTSMEGNKYIELKNEEMEPIKIEKNN